VASVPKPQTSACCPFKTKRPFSRPQKTSIQRWFIPQFPSPVLLSLVCQPLKGINKCKERKLAPQRFKHNKLSLHNAYCVYVPALWSVPCPAEISAA
jgi:hypothetical protein